MDGLAVLPDMRRNEVMEDKHQSIFIYNTFYIHSYIKFYHYRFPLTNLLAFLCLIGLSFDHNLI